MEGGREGGRERKREGDEYSHNKFIPLIKMHECHVHTCIYPHDTFLGSTPLCEIIAHNVIKPTDDKWEMIV